MKERRITVQAKNEKLSLILERIEKQSSFVFVYANDEVNTAQKVTVIIKEKNLNEALTDLRDLPEQPRARVPHVLAGDRHGTGFERGAVVGGDGRGELGAADVQGQCGHGDDIKRRVSVAAGPGPGC